MDPLQGAIRTVETEILDNYHAGQLLLRRSQIEAVSYLLKGYGNIVRDFFSPELHQLTTDVWLTELEIWSRALEQSLRWVLKHCEPRHSFSSDSWVFIDKEALSLMSWARSYVKLCTDHTAASRGHYTASCDEARREIRFQYKDKLDPSILICQRASWPLHTNAFLKDAPEAELSGLFARWKDKVDLGKLNSLPPFEHDSAEPNYQCIKDWARKAILPELDDSEDLNGFTLRQLRDFWAFLFIESQLVTRLECYVDQVLGPENSLGSVMYQDSAPGLAHYYAQVYGMDSRTLLTIIDCLTFDGKSPKSTLTNSPFIKTGCGTVSLLCRRVVTIDPNIMLASALAKRSRKHLYAALINKIEKNNLTQIAEAFRKAGFAVLVEEPLLGKDKSKISPDFVIYEPATEQVLISDYKHALPPSGAAEVDNRMRDLEKWTEQMRRYLRFAESNREVIKAKLGCRNITCFGSLLLFRWPLALPAALQTDVSCGDWTSLAVILREIKGPKINEILKFYRQPRDADQQLRDWKIGEESISVGSWTYRRPLFVSPRKAT